MLNTLNIWLVNHLAILMALSYLIGSIPFSLLVARLKNINLRSVGSGNLGATNVYRAMGFKYAFLVFLLDATKGGIPTAIALNSEHPTVHILTGFMAILGHSLSPFVRFKGGKGAATGLGVLAILAPDVFGILFVIAAILIAVTRYVAPATMICSILAPALLYAFDYQTEYVVFTGLIALFIIYRHRTNILRIVKGTENRV